MLKNVNKYQIIFFLLLICSPFVFFIDAYLNLNSIERETSYSSKFYALLTVVFFWYVGYKFFSTQIIKYSYLTTFLLFMILASTFNFFRFDWSIEVMLRDFILLSYYFVISILFAGKIHHILDEAVVYKFFKFVVIFQLVLSLIEMKYPIFKAGNIDFDRLTNVYAHPNVFAMVLVIQVLLTLYFIEGKVHGKKILYTILALLVLNIFLTKSLTAIFIVMLLFFIEIIRNASITKIVLVSVSLIIMVIVLSNTVFYDRYLEITQLFDAVIHQDLNKMNYGSLYWRLLIWGESLNYLYDSMYIGFGIGLYPYITNVGNLAHSDYIKYLIEGGVIGLLLYLFSLANLFGKISFKSGNTNYTKLVSRVFLVLILSSLSLNVFNYTPVMTLIIILMSGYSRTLKLK